MARSSGPRIVDVLADIARELRLSNQLAALRLGSTELEHDKGVRATTPTTLARVARKNALRAEVRSALGLEDEEVRDGDRA